MKRKVEAASKKIKKHTAAERKTKTREASVRLTLKTTTTETRMKHKWLKPKRRLVRTDEKTIR